MPRKTSDVERTSSPKVDKTCCFCGLKDDNELEYGKFHEYDGIVTHYYCLLFSSNMQQRGQDEEGILGFLSEDINKELRRGKRIPCCYCKKIGATLGCCNTKCKRIFHFPCGLKSGSLHQFFGEFKSYCKTHRPIQTIDKRVLQDIKDRETICYICYDDVNPHDSYGTLWAPCCKKNAWFHRTCVQQLAMSAGYFFKCPLCNNKNEFQKAMLDYGIFIPSQDASWELVPNAFEELLYRHNRCDAPKCLCPKGREHVSTNAKWELTLCRTCGSQGIHMACGSLKWVKPVWECSECTLILNKSATNNTNEKSSLRRFRNIPSPQNDCNLLTDDESSDSDISVGGLPDLRTQVSVDPQSDSEPSIRFQKPDETESDLEENRISPRYTRRSSLARSATTNFTINHEPTKICSPLDEELPPLPKKPRIQPPAVNSKEQETDDDSDDDIMVISGPSRGENSVESANRAKSPVAQFERVFVDPPSPEMLKEDESPISTNIRHEESINNEKCPTPSKISSETSKTESRVTKRPPLVPVRPPPVEIDLSDGEIIVQEKLSAFETSRTSEFGKTTQSFTDTPEMNLKITNVTSLPPGAFEFEPEPNIQLSEAMNNYNIHNAGLTSQDPIILDDKSSPTKAPQNNNMHIDELTIVRFEGVTTVSGDKGKSIIYGLTIPGTKHTVPFIVTPPENCTSETPGIHVDPKSPLGIALCDCNSSKPPSFADLLKLSVFNGSAPNGISNPSTTEKTPNPNISKKPVNPSSTSSTAVSTKQNMERSSRQNAERSSKHDVERSMKRNLQRSVKEYAEKSAVRNPERPVAPKSTVDPKSWSVPLKSIVNSNSMEKSSSNDGRENYASFVRINGSSAPPKMTVTLQAKPILPNGNESSATAVRSNTTLQKSNAVARGNMLMPNEMASDIFTFAPSRSTPASQINVPPVNGVVPLADAEFTRDLPRSKHANNRVWANVNGSYVPIDPDVAENINLSAKAAPSQLQVPQSTPIDQNLPMFRFIHTEHNVANDSSNNCDGDAGSGPAVQPTSVPTNTRPHRAPGPASFRRACAAYDDWKRNNFEGIYERWSDCHKTVTADCSASTEGDSSCDRAGLIHKTINLRDIKFKVGGPNIVKMTLYETYNVNIKVDTTSRCTYENPDSVLDHDSSTHRKTDRSSLSPESEISKAKNSDSLPHANSAINDCLNYTNNSSNDTVSRQSESSFEDNFSTLETVTNQSQMNVASRGQDELKENRDPVPPSTNSMNTTGIVERKSKTRPRTGVNNSIRFLNEKEIQGTTSEKIDASPQKIGANNSCRDTNESLKLVTSIETAINKSVVPRDSNESENANIIEKFEAAQRLKMSIKDKNPSDTRELAESTNDTKNYDSSAMKSLIGKVRSSEIAEKIETHERKRQSGKNEDSDFPQNYAKLKTTHGPESFKSPKTKPLIKHSNDTDIMRHFDAAKRRRISTNDKDSNEKSSEKMRNTNDSKNCIRVTVNPLVNNVARSKRKSMDHVSRSSKFNVNNIFDKGKTVASSESLCCKVSIDLTRVRQILAKKLKVSVDVKFHERNEKCFGNGGKGKNVFDSKSFRKRKASLTRSRSFHHLESFDYPGIDRTSILGFRRSKSVDNVYSFSSQHRCSNGIIGENRRNSCKRNTRIFEKHDCLR